MGQIHIKMIGSFPVPDHLQVDAEVGGHAFAIQRAIEWLNTRLPAAIQLDHRLHDKGERPPASDFGRKVE